ncbi:MAG: FKBP-type peptidyl-prolyl cis-trans isomerase [Pseudomonadota bacterium]
MQRKLPAVLLVLLVINGCGKEEAEVPSLVAALAGPVTAADVADCPVVADNGKIAISDGLDATVLDNGYGRVALLGDDVVVKAKLWVYDEQAEGGKGAFVWESGPAGFAFQLGADGFIEGWSPGIACMLVGEKRELIIASELAYGERGRAPIPPNADIIYDLELMKVAETEPGS